MIVPVRFLEHAKQIKQADVGGFGLDGNFTELVHDAFTRTFLHEFVASFHHECAFALHILHEPLVGQFVIRSGHGEHADAQFLGELAQWGSASPAVRSPDMIADLIWFLICS